MTLRPSGVRPAIQTIRPRTKVGFGSQKPGNAPVELTAHVHGGRMSITRDTDSPVSYTTHRYGPDAAVQDLNVGD